MKNIQILLSEAQSNGICSDWAEMIAKAKNRAQLLQMYIDGIDFCLSTDFPSKDYLKRNGKGLLQKFGIWIDEILQIENPAKLVLLGGCSAKVSVSDYAISQIFIKHTSGATVTVADHAFAVIDVFDNCVLSITAGQESKVLVNVYGNAKIGQKSTDNARIKVVHKHKNTY